MNFSKGISLISLVITIIVILVITSVTVYTGIDLITDARKKDAEDKLKVICNSLRKDDSFIYEETLENMQLTEQDYITLDLKEYYDEDYPVYLNKAVSKTDTETRVTYTLNMYKGDNTSKIYATVSFEIPDVIEKHTYEADFNDKAGVNRPLIMDNMIALSNDGTSFVEDLYTENWYNYNSSSPSFAKMKYDKNGDGTISSSEDMIYVWIPRFAYKMQTFYDGSFNPEQKHRDVPQSAIQIVFLRGTSRYMNNNEVLPSGYIIHPAFNQGDVELSGIWVAFSATSSKSNFSSAISSASGVVGSGASFSSHLMTNSEYSAAIYLMFALDAYNQINFTAEDEFVAAVLSGASEASNDYVDVYNKDAETASGLADKIGDAIMETNWDRMKESYLTDTNQCFVRLLETGYFDFGAVSKSSSYSHRAVIICEQ